MLFPHPEGLWLVAPVRDTGGAIVDFLITAHPGSPNPEKFTHDRKWSEYATSLSEASVFQCCVDTLTSGTSGGFELQAPKGDRWFAGEVFRQDQSLLVHVRDITKTRIASTDLEEHRKVEDRLQEALDKEKQLARDARAAERAKSEFLAVMSHEIRTPMNGVLGFAELLEQTELDPQQQDYIKTIRRSGRTLLRIIDDILDYSRLEAGRLNIVQAPFSLRQLLHGVKDLLGPGSRHKGLSLICEISPEIPDHFIGGVDRLQQVLLNLVGNAIKFTARGSVTLGITLGEEMGTYKFYVRDTGIGIQEAQIKHIFQPFVQADYGAARRYGGTGLGLAISQRFVEVMGGRLEVGRGIDGGSEFYFSIPLEPTDQEPLASLPQTSRPEEGFALAHPLNILVAEDDTVNRKLLIGILRKLGYESLIAVNGNQALKLFETRSPNCVLMDLHMPEMDGVEVTRRIRANQNGQIPYIAALTADVMSGERANCLNAGMDEFLTKPLNRNQLKSALVRAAERTAS